MSGGQGNAHGESVRLLHATGQLVAALPALKPEVRFDVVGEAMDDLASFAGDARIDDTTVINRLTTVIRLLRPAARKAEKPPTREQALDQLTQVLEEGLLPRGRRPIGAPRTVRATDEVWRSVDAEAAARGIEWTEVARERLAVRVGGLYDQFLEATRPGSSSDDVVRLVDDWFVAQGYRSVLFRQHP